MKLSSANALNLDKTKILSSGRRLAISCKAFENIVGKGENAGNQHFLLVPRCFLPYQRDIAPFESQ